MPVPLLLEKYTYIVIQLSFRIGMLSQNMKDTSCIIHGIVDTMWRLFGKVGNTRIHIYTVYICCYAPIIKKCEKKVLLIFCNLKRVAYHNFFFSAVLDEGPFLIFSVRALLSPISSLYSTSVRTCTIVGPLLIYFDQIYIGHINLAFK